MSKFLDGCGVDYVHWLPAPTLNGKPMPICKTPVLAAQGLKSARIRRALVRNGIENWETLAAVKREDFHGWRNYGEKSHALLVAIASANGYLVETWYERTFWQLNDN